MKHAFGPVATIENVNGFGPLNVPLLTSVLKYAIRDVLWKTFFRLA